MSLFHIIHFVAFAVETAVAERQDEVGCDHENVGNVEKHHIA